MTWLGSWGDPWYGSWYGSSSVGPTESVNYWMPTGTFTFDQDVIFGPVTTPTWARDPSPREVLLIFDPRAILLTYRKPAP